MIGSCLSIIPPQYHSNHLSFIYIVHIKEHVQRCQINVLTQTGFRNTKDISLADKAQKFIQHVCLPCGWCPTDPLMWMEIFTLICLGFCVCFCPLTHKFKCSLLHIAHEIQFLNKSITFNNFFIQQCATIIIRTYLPTFVIEALMILDKTH